MNKNIETLATALYVKIDDMLKDWPDLAPPRPASGIAVTLSDAELLTLAVMSALLGFTSERRWLRFVNAHLAGMFPRRIGQSGYNKRMRKAFFLFICVVLIVAQVYVWLRKPKVIEEERAIEAEVPKTAYSEVAE